jgi:peptidoglycan/LPS O-acetylase OafA/YrhL
MNPQTAPPSTHVAWLDSVRGLAALSVIGSHYVNSYDLPCQSSLCAELLSNTPLHIWWDGAAAVSMFFVLSGLVLSLKYFRHTKTPDLSGFSLIGYLLGRVWRIWPPYLAALFISILLHQLYQATADFLPSTIPRQNDWLPLLWGRDPNWENVYKDSFLLGMKMDTFFLPQAWTLNIELALSFLVPLGILAAARHSAWLVFFFLFAIKPLGLTPYLIHFMLGILLAKHHSELVGCLQQRGAYRKLLWLLAILLYTSGTTLNYPLPGALLSWMAALGSALLLLNTMASARSKNLLNLPLLRYVGKISYSIYLLHFAVLFTATPRFLVWLDASPKWFVPAWWLGLLFTIVGSIAVSALSYRWVEMPSMAIGKRLSRRFDAAKRGQTDY